MSERLLTVSFGENDPAKIISVKHLTWPEFCQYLCQSPPVAEDKAQFGWYCPVEFEKPRRHGKYFIARHAITWDVDQADMFALEDVDAFFTFFNHAIYPTFSSTTERPRFRIVAPLSRPCGYDEFQAVSRRLAADLSIELFARESHVPCQMMYAPTRRADSPPHWSHSRIDGAAIDVDAALSRYADWTDRSSWPHRAKNDGVHQKDTKVSPLDKPGIVGAFCRAYTISAAIEKFDLPYTPAGEGRWTYTKGSRPEGAVSYDDDTQLHSHHDTDPAHGQNNAFDLVRCHRFAELDTDPALPITQQPSFKAMVWLANEQPQIAKASAAQLFTDISSQAVTADPAAPQEIPEIQLKGAAIVESSLAEALTTLEGLAPSAGLVIYANRLMRVLESHERRGFGGVKVPTVELLPCSAEQLPAMLVGRCRFWRAVKNEDTGKSYKQYVDLPAALAKAIVTKAAAMQRAAVDRISSTPLLHHGTLLAARGHCVEHRAWILAPEGVVLGDTTLAGARAALSRLTAWLDEFPFDTAEDRTVALAAILTAALRASLDHAPGFVVSKPDYGSGASTLCDIINIVLSGRPAPVINADAGKAEIDKTIDSVMFAGLPSIVIDNVVDGQTFNSIALAQVISQPSRQIRILGKSETLLAPCTQMVLVNGNNISIADDLVRRFVMIRLNPRCESPHRRAFKHPDIVAQCQRARAQILSDCYTIIEACRLAEAVEIEPLAGFEGWTRSVAASLVWLGLPSPILSQARIEREDPRKIQWRGIMHAWYAAFGSEPMTIRDALEQDFEDGTPEKMSSRAELHRLAAEICLIGGRAPATLTVAFGQKLRGMAEKVLGGLIFDSPAKTRDDQKLWRLRRADEMWLDT